MGVHKTHGQENTAHKKAKSSAHLQQVITKHIVKKTQHTKEPRGQLFPAGYQKHILKKTQHTKEPRGQPISRTL